MQLTNLSDEGVDLLTGVLHFKHGEDAIQYSNRTLAAIKALPSSSQRDSRLSLMIRAKQSQTQLCELHKHLNADLAHSLFNLIVIEAAGRLNNLCFNIGLLPVHQQDRIRRVRGVHQLWLGEALFCATFPTAQPSEKWHYQEDCCEACSITRMMSDLEFLTDLMIVVGSRHQKPRPSILCFLESFLVIHQFQMDDVTEKGPHLSMLFAETTNLRHARVKLHKMRLVEGVPKGQPLTPVMEIIPEEVKMPELRKRPASAAIVNPRPDPEAEPRDDALSNVNLYDHLQSSPHLPMEEMAMFNEANAFHPGLQPGAAAPPGLSPLNRRYTQLGIPNPFSKPEREELPQPKKWIAPGLKNWIPPPKAWHKFLPDMGVGKVKQSADTPHVYLRKDREVTLEQYQKMRRGEANNPFSKSTESFRGSQTTLLDRKAAYMNLVGSTSELSVASPALARPTDMGIQTAVEGTWEDASCPPSPTSPTTTVKPMPTQLKSQASSIYDRASLKPSIARSVFPDSSSQLGFERYFAEQPQPPARAGGSRRSISIYSRQPSSDSLPPQKQVYQAYNPMRHSPPKQSPPKESPPTQPQPVLKPQPSSSSTIHPPKTSNNSSRKSFHIESRPDSTSHRPVPSPTTENVSGTGKPRESYTIQHRSSDESVYMNGGDEARWSQEVDEEITRENAKATAALNGGKVR